MRSKLSKWVKAKPTSLCPWQYLELVDVFYNMKVTPVILEKSATTLPSFAEEIRVKVLEKIEEKGIRLHTNV
jgi:NADPH-dependent 2,4-dienoyl-CoA reductase/sulfur reductase-like enzyme